MRTRAKPKFTVEDQERWCLRQWLEYRRDLGLPQLTDLGKPEPPGPDRCYGDGERVVGVEVTQIVDAGELRADRFAESFFKEEIVPLVGDRVPGLIFVHAQPPWRVVGRTRRKQLARRVADIIIRDSEKLRPGESVNSSRSPLRLTITRGTAGATRQLAWGGTGFHWGWEPERYMSATERIATAIGTKWQRAQLDRRHYDVRVLLLHDQMWGIDVTALDNAIAMMNEASGFDEIYLVSTYNDGRCYRGSPGHGPKDGLAPPVPPR